MPYGSDPTSLPDAVPVPKSDPRSLSDVKPGEEFRVTIPAGRAPASMPRAEGLPGLIPELAPIVQRESGGKPFVGYTPPGQPLVDLSNAPLDETGFPIWEGNIDPSTGKRSHAAGIAQIQPDTWRPIAKQLGIKDFSIESQIKVANELHKQQGEAPWAASAGGYGKDPVIGSGKWNVSDEYIQHGLKIPDSSFEWMDPATYLALRGESVETDADSKSKRTSLRRSVDSGDQIMDPITLDVKRDGNKLKAEDGDGANRARLAIENGVGLIPVVIEGYGGPQAPMAGQAPAEPPAEIEGISGKTFPYAFKPVQAPKLPEPSQRPGSLQDRLAARGGLYIDLPKPSTQSSYLGDTLGRAPGEIADALKDIGRTVAGIGERGELAEEAVGTGQPMQQPQISVQPGFERLGDMSTFMTGGLTRGPGEEINALRAMGAGARPNILADRPPIPTGAAPAAPVNALAPKQAGLENQARELISRRFADRASGSGASVGDVVDRLMGARGEGQPMTLADIPELQGLAGAVSRVTGEAGARIRSFFTGRQGDSLRRLDDILARYLPTGSVKRTIEEVANQRAEAAAPVYQEAFAGGSIAPLEKQLQGEWNTAAGVAKNAEQNAARIENELNAALARKSTAGNVYSSSAANRATTFANDKLAQQRRIAMEAREAEQSALQRLRQAQQDGTANTPGAIWSPTIQRLITNPRVQVGIRKGLKIERDLADAEGRPMRLNEYAIVGTDEAGEPIVGAVPNMRLLAAAKKGLDSMVAGMRDTAPPWRLTEEGRAVDKLRRTLLDQLYRLNPKYKEANEIWSGGAESIRAMTDGQRALNRSVSVEDIRDQLDKLPEGARDFYRLGVADDARKDLLNVALSSDKSKAVVNSEAAREKLRVIIGSPEAAEQFIQAIENERTMFNTGRTVTGGSQTAERLAEDSSRLPEAAVQLGHALIRLKHGNVPGAVVNVLRLMRTLQGDKTLAKNPALANEVAKLLTDPSLAISRSGPALSPLPTPQGNALTRYGRGFTSPYLP